MFELTCHSLRIERKETFEHGLVLFSHDRGKAYVSLVFLTNLNLLSLCKLSNAYESQLLVVSCRNNSSRIRDVWAKRFMGETRYGRNPPLPVISSIC